MKIIRTKNDLVALRQDWQRSGVKIGVVPTMGALHAGHLSLIDAAKAHSDKIILTIFVNPAQFNNPEDLDQYPRREEADLKQLAPLNVDAVYIPTTGQIYPEGFATTVSVSGLTEDLEGRLRPGHFDGVATVVSKLLLQTRADFAFFGEKDYQQLLLVRRLVRDLDIDSKIIGCPTMREQDGLAMSSRNLRLSEQERKIAPLLYAQMQWAGAEISQGADIQEALEAAGRNILQAGFSKVEYLELRDAHSLAKEMASSGSLRLLAAAQLGQVRLIDNIEITPKDISD